MTSLTSCAQSTTECPMCGSNKVQRNANALAGGSDAPVLCKYGNVNGLTNTYLIDTREFNAVHA
jgi:hypothetical protein